MSDHIDIAFFRKLLEERLEALESRRQSQKDDEKPVELDQTKMGRLSRMDAMQQQAMAQASGRRTEQEKQRIMAALKRVEAGEYGYCAKCEEEISPGRLRFDPSVLTCIACAKAAERR